MIDSQLFKSALEKGALGARLSPDEATALAQAATPETVMQLGEAALANRQRLYGQKSSYINNLQINPTNICEGGCAFCRYARKPNEDGAYVLTEAEILAKVEQVAPTEVHVVGGVNDIWNYQRSRELIRSLRSLNPDLFIKAFTAVEIDGFSQRNQISVEQVLTELASAGLNALPGGGAELFAPRIRQLYCKDKLSGSGWLRVHQAAHKLGLTSNATMLYGIDETPQERVSHLLALRAQQDKSGGFRAFIPLAYQSDDYADHRPPPLVSLAVIALSRLVLDNFDHIKAYWPMLGLSVAAAALCWGADDLDGTLGQEKIAHAAGARAPAAMARTRLTDTIRLGGFTPWERDGRFNQKIAVELPIQ